VNLDHNWGSRLTASVGLGAIRNVLDRGLANNDNSFTSPVYAFAYTPAVFDLRERDAAGNYVRNPIFGGGLSASNPFETYEYLQYNQDVGRQLGSATLRWSALSRGAHRLDATLIAGFDRYEQAGRLYSPGFLQYEGRNGLFGTSEQSTVDGLNSNLQGTATWTYAATSWLALTSTVGASLERQSVNDHALIGRGLAPGAEGAAQGTITGSQSFTAFRDQAVFVDERVSAFDDRLIVNGGVRADRSSANGDPARFFVFPRASAAYRLLAPIAHLDEVKLRAGWGQTGNRPRFGDRDITLAAGGIVQGQTGVQVASLIGNPDITPETLTEVSGGVDLQAFGGRLDFEGTLYSRTITDLLLQPSAAPSTGFSTLVVNAGTLRNRGVELALGGTPLQWGDASWTSRVTWQRRTEVVVDLPESVPPFSAPNSFGASFGRNRITPGRRTSSIWGNVPVDAAGNVLPVGAYVTSPALVAARVDTIIGDANPDWQSFFENTLAYRRLRLGFTLDWRRGGDVANTTTKLYDEGGQSRDFTTPLTAANAPRGVPAQDVGRVPAAVLGLGDFRFRSWNGGSDARAYLQDGSFVRLREIALTLDAPTSVARRVGAQGLRVGVQARNVALWSDYWGYDPEFNNFGNQNLNRFIDTAPYPGARSVHLSIDLTY
jgi:outer membrane receptor protein involved in Fe transport